MHLTDAANYMASFSSHCRGEGSDFRWLLGWLITGDRRQETLANLVSSVYLLSRKSPSQTHPHQRAQLR